MTIDYDNYGDPEECSNRIYEQLKELPSEIKINLQRLIRNCPLTRSERISLEIMRPLETAHFTDLSDLYDIED